MSRTFGPTKNNEFITEDILNHLKEKGWVVVPSVISSEECKEIKTELWDWLESLQTGIHRDDHTTWKGDKWVQHLHGIVTYPSACHIKPTWKVRGHENVVKCFSELWGSNELLSSFDRINLMKPPTKGGSTRNKAWPHLDQGSKLQGLHCVQGWITTEDVGDKEGTLMILEGSHKKHTQFFEKVASDSSNRPIASNWFKMNEEKCGDLKWWTDNGCVEKAIFPVSKGSLVLWDSRVVHWNRPPASGGDKWRMVFYVCMTPKSWADEKQKEKRRLAFLNQRGTSHWPHIVKMFEKKPRTYGKEFPPYKIDDSLLELNDTQLKLAGFANKADFVRRVNEFKNNTKEKKTTITKKVTKTNGSNSLVKKLEKKANSSDKKGTKRKATSLPVKASPAKKSKK